MRQDVSQDVVLIDRPNAQRAILPLLVTLLGELNRHRVSYCYWKSSRRIRRGLTGDGDLDLLIGREDRHRAQAILLEQGFKLCACVPHRNHPALSSFLGYDEPSGRLIHLHLHFWLVAGSSLIKNYRLPWEHSILARAIIHPALQIRMLDPVSEAVLLVVRSCLELQWSDPIIFRSWRAARQKFVLDREHLAARVERIELRQRAAELLSDDLADMVVDSLYGRPALKDQFLLRRLIRKHLAVYCTYNAVEAALRSAGRAVLWTLGAFNKGFLHAVRPWSRCAPGGGCVAAVIGVDGSGKTTVVREMRAWLGQEIDVIPIYFGTGDGRPSLLLWPFKLMVPLISPLVKNRFKGASHGGASGRARGALYATLLSIWAVAVAMEKRTKLAAARRGASRGLVILTDRYPQNEIPEFNEAPLLGRLTWLPHGLRRFEATTYALAQRVPPDLVIKLVVTPGTAARREPSMDPTIIRERIVALQRLQFSGSRVVGVNAEQPLAEVLRAVKQEIWRLL